jgi:hypothetical protein
MGYVTKEQIERAREVDVLDYILSYESGNIRRVGNGYRLKDHESLAVTAGKWYWHSRGFGGRTALDYLTGVRGYSLIDAVCLLIGERPIEHGIKTDAPGTYKDAPARPITPNAKPPPERAPFSMPIRNRDNRRVIAYLQSRGIDRDLITVCINRGSLYESMTFHNAVFTGRDEKGRTRFAAMRGTTSDFKCDADGSDKKYGFSIPPKNPNSHEVAVFEAPIDCLSHQTLCKQGLIPPFDGWRLSLGGTSILALEHFLETHKEVSHCLICTDNDEAGNKAAAKIAELQGISAERLLSEKGYDWNDTLLSMQKAERTKHRPRDSKTTGL